MNDITRPIVLVYLPIPEPSSAAKSPSAHSHGDGDDWLEVERAPNWQSTVDPGFMRLRSNSGVVSPLVTPLYTEDLANKQAQGIKEFCDAAHKALGSIDGAKMRLYWENIAQVPRPSLEQCVQITMVDLAFFAEKFRSLKLLEGCRSLGRPNLLRVAARFLGNSQNVAPNFSDLLKLTVRRLEALQPQVKKLQGQEPGTLTMTDRELLQLYYLMVAIFDALDDPQVQRLLAPDEPLLGRAANAGLRVANCFWAGAQKVSDSLVARLQPKPEPDQSL